MKKIKIEDGWNIENIYPNDYSKNNKRYHNWIAVVNGYSSNGQEVREYLPESNSSDSYFFFNNKVTEGDIIAVGCFDRYKIYNSVCKYYKILGITTEEIVLSDVQSTYRKAKNIDNNNDNQKENE